MLREHSSAGTDDARYVDRHGVSALRRAPVLSADRHISWQTFVQANNETEEVRDAAMGEMKRASVGETSTQKATRGLNHPSDCFGECDPVHPL
jgi:hypothetical protein